MKKEGKKNLIRRLTAFAQQFADINPKADGVDGIAPTVLERLKAEASFALTGRKPTGQHFEVAAEVAKLNKMGPKKLAAFLAGGTP